MKGSMLSLLATLSVSSVPCEVVPAHPDLSVLKGPSHVVGRVKDEAGGNADQVQVQVSGADSKGDKTDATGLYHVIASGDTFVMMFKKVGYLTAVTDEIASSESPIKVTEISLRRNEGKLEENVLYLQSQHKKIKSIKNAEIQRWAQGVFELQLKQVGEQHGLQLKDLTERIKTER